MVEISPLIEVIAQEYQGAYREELRGFLGPGDDAALAAWVERLVAHVMGEPVIGASFSYKSAGTVFGLTLASGERVVLKLFWPVYSYGELLAFERCLDHVHARGFPAVRLRRRVFRTDRDLYAAVFEHVDVQVEDPHRPEVRREMAGRLAQLNTILAEVDPSGLPPSPARGERLFPPTHRPSIDIETSRADTDWIDVRARAAKEVVRAAQLPLQPAHLDWSPVNACWRDGAICVLDWDSLGVASEAEAVGRACAQFTAQWELPQRLTPTHAEAREFVAEYEVARGRAFPAEERRVLAAAADYCLANLARFEAVDAEPRSDGYVQLLRECSSEPLIPTGA